MLARSPRTPHVCSTQNVADHFRRLLVAAITHGKRGRERERERSVCENISGKATLSSRRRGGGVGAAFINGEIIQPAERVIPSVTLGAALRCRVRRNDPYFGESSDFSLQCNINIGTVEGKRIVIQKLDQKF